MDGQLDERGSKEADAGVCGQSFAFGRSIAQKSRLTRHRFPACPLRHFSRRKLSRGMQGEEQGRVHFIIDAGLMPPKRIEALLQEARELTAIFTVTMKTARQNRDREN